MTTIKIPSDIKYPSEGCRGLCPFFDNGDGGYGSDCNLMSIGFMSQKTFILYKRYDELNKARIGYLDKKCDYLEYLEKKYTYARTDPFYLRKEGAELLSKRSRKVRDYKVKLDKKLKECYKYYRKCPFYGKDFRLEVL